MPRPPCGPDHANARGPAHEAHEDHLARFLNRACLAAAAIAALCLIAVEYRTPLPRHYDYDEGVYTATAAAMAQGARLYRDVFLAQPPLLVLALRGVFGVLGASVPAARALAIAASFGWMAAIVGVLRARRCSWGAAAAAALLAGQGAFVAQARSVEMEGLSEALACAALWLAAVGQLPRRRAWWAGAGGAAILAAMTKLTALTVFLPLLAWMFEDGGRSGRARLASFAAGAAAALAALLPLIGGRAFVDQALWFHIAVARAVPRFSETVQSPSAHLAAIARFVVQAWPLAAASALGAAVVALRPPRWAAWALVAWAAADVAALTVLTPLWDHHLVILFSPLGMLGGIGLQRLCAGLGPARGLVRPALTAGLLALLSTRAVLPGAAAPAPRASEDLNRAVHMIEAGVPAGRAVLTDDPMIALLARRPLAGRLIDTSLARIWAGEISEAELAAAARDPNTAAVVLWRGTFRQYFPALWPGVARAFSTRVPMAGGRLVLSR